MSVARHHRALVIGAFLLVLAAGAHQAPGHAAAAGGDHLRSISAGIAPCTVKGTGIAFDGTNLLLDCWFTGKIDRVSPIDGSAGAPFTVSVPGDFGALSFDRSRGRVWACSGGSSVYLIDVASATAALQFTSAACTDGLSHDPTDDTIWSGCQDCDNLYHYTAGGTLLATYTGMMSKLGGHGVGGIAVVGSQLYISNGRGGQIYRCSKDASSCVLFAASGGKTDDLECDDVTFAPRTVIWSQHPFQRQFDAWQVDAACADQAPPPSPTPTPTITPPPALPAVTPTIQPFGNPVTPTRPAPAGTPEPPPQRTPGAPVRTAAGVTVSRLPDTGDATTPASAESWLAPLVTLFAAGCLALICAAAYSARHRRALRRPGSRRT